MSFWYLSPLLLVGCTLSDERYLELRALEECRILGPECAESYTSVAACLGDGPIGGQSLEGDTFQGDAAFACVSELRDLCPATIEEYVLPKVCTQVSKGLNE